MRRYAFITLDVFTERRFGGNPLAVLPDAVGLTDDEMQAITREFDFSETVFLLPPDDARHTRRARIFTPAREIPFAGHPTIGAAVALAQEGAVELAGGRGELVLEEGVGPVRVTLAESGRSLRAELTAAVAPERLSGAASAEALARMASLSPSDFADGTAPEVWSCGFPYAIVELRDRDALGRARLDPVAWRDLVAASPANAVLYFARDAAEPGHDLRARMFAPGFSVPEDPATGSAAVALAGRLGRGLADGEHRWTVEQGYEMGRPSQLYVTARVRDGATVEARVAGHAVRFATGHLHL